MEKPLSVFSFLLRSILVALLPGIFSAFPGVEFAIVGWGQTVRDFEQSGGGLDGR